MGRLLAAQQAKRLPTDAREKIERHIETRTKRPGRNPDHALPTQDSKRARILEGSQGREEDLEQIEAAMEIERAVDSLGRILDVADKIPGDTKASMQASFEAYLALNYGQELHRDPGTAGYTSGTFSGQGRFPNVDIKSPKWRQNVSLIIGSELGMNKSDIKGSGIYNMDPNERPDPFNDSLMQAVIAIVEEGPIFADHIESLGEAFAEEVEASFA